MLLRELWNAAGKFQYKWNMLFSRLWPMEVSFKGGSVGTQVRFYGRPIISKSPGSRLVIGNNVHVYSELRSNVLGCFQPCVFRTLFPEAEIIIESNVGMSATVLCAGSSIHIREGAVIGAGAMLMDTDFHTPRENLRWDVATQDMAKPIHVGRGVFIGARAIILKGVSIGDGAVVGAGAVVSKNVPPYHLAIGNPAQTRPLRREDVLNREVKSSEIN